MSRRFWQTADFAPPLDNPGHRCPRDIFGGGGGETVNTNTVQNADPWSGVQPYMSDVFNRAQSLANRGAYSGPYLANQSPYTQQAIAAQAQRAQAGSPLLGQAQDQLGKTIDGDYLKADSNPYLKGAVDDALGLAQARVSSQFSGDNFGGSANQEWLGRTLASAALPVYAQNYELERGRQLAAGSMAPGLAAADYADINQLGAAGAAQESRGQAEISAQQQAYAAPWDNLFAYQRGIAGGLGAGGTTTTSGQQPYYSNPMSSALGLGIGGLNLYNGLGQAGLLGGAGAGIAAAATPEILAGAGLLSFSDRRLKSNIRRIGTHRIGVGVYAYDIAGHSQIGVMADEVEAVRPDAVVSIGAFKAVDYGRI